MTTWQRIIHKVKKAQEEWAQTGCDTPFFRGHQISTWQLLCSLGRGRKSELRTTIESALYYDFLSHAGPLLPPKASSWDVAFAMQHHGLPTRLLDWTNTFAVALYFAIAPGRQRPRRNDPGACIWMLNTFGLNERASKDAAIYNPEIDLQGGYYENFIIAEKTLGCPVMAVNPNRTSPRQAAQRSVFTLHNDLWTPLEDYAPHQLIKIEIPKPSFAEAIDFLKMAGINEFALFPDFDGLARQLMHDNAKYFSRR